MSCLEQATEEKQTPWKPSSCKRKVGQLSAVGKFLRILESRLVEQEEVVLIGVGRRAPSAPLQCQSDRLELRSSIL